MEKYVLITGASSGIGKTTAIKLAQNGYKVFAGIRKQEDKISVESENSNIQGIFLDVTDIESIKSAFNEISKFTDVLYALINNAGIAYAGAVECLPVETIQKQFDINVFGAIRVAQQFMPMLYNSKIVNISSMASFGLFPFISPYCASKRSLDIFFNALMLECKSPELKVISIKPGVIKTKIWEKSIEANKKVMESLPESSIEKYRCEFEYLVKNAEKNKDKGLDPERVAGLILKVLNSKNPRPSYTIGADAKMAELFSRLPLCITNFFTKFIMKKRMN